MTAKSKKPTASKSTTKKTTSRKTDAAKPKTPAASAAKTGTAAKTGSPKKAVTRKPKPSSTTTAGVIPTPEVQTTLAPIAVPSVVNTQQTVVLGPAMRKKQIIDAVVERSGLKKRDVKPVLDHLLAVMGDALADGKELVVPPMGRIKTHKKKQSARKTIFFTKIHQNAAPDVVADTDQGGLNTD